MTQINPNINNQDYKTQNRPQIAPKNVAYSQVKIPKYYDVSNDNQRPSLKESLKDSFAYDIIFKPFVEHPIAVLLTWLGYCVAYDSFSKACSGKYENSLVKKVANFGDNIENSKLIQNKPVQGVLKGIKQTGRAGSSVANKSAILRAVKNTPTMPEWQMAKAQMFNQKQEVVQDFLKITDGLCLEGDGMPKLKNLGLNNSEKELLKKTFNVRNINDILQEKAVNQILLHRLGKTPEEINKIQNMGAASNRAVKDAILKEMGIDAEKLKLMKDDMYGKYIDEAKEAAGRVKGRVRIGAGKFTWLGPFTKPFERNISCDEVYNKLHSLSDGAKTGTGRFLSKAVQMIHRGLTFGGGKLGGLVFIAPIVVETAVNVKKADSDRKVGTAAGGLINSISWVFTFPLAFKIMHAIGGIKYAGMTKDQVEQVRKLKRDFNEKAGDGFIAKIKSMFSGGNIKPSQFKNKTEYNIEKANVKKEVKKLTKVKGQNIFTKGIRKIVSILTMDLENLKGYSGGGTASKFYHDLPHLLKDAGGIPLRFIAWGLLSMGLLDMLIEKGTAAVFGKSYDAMKQDEHNDAKKAQQQFLMDDLNERLYNKQLSKYQPKPVPASSGNMITSRGKAGNKKASLNEAESPIEDCRNDSKMAFRSNKINEVEEKVDNYTYIPSQENIIPHPIKKGSVDNYTYIPSSECTIQSDKVNENNRKYIPSQAAANIHKTFDNSGLQSALDRAQRAEDKALRVLAGNFDGM